MSPRANKEMLTGIAKNPAPAFYAERKFVRVGETIFVDENVKLHRDMLQDMAREGVEGDPDDAGFVNKLEKGQIVFYGESSSLKKGGSRIARKKTAEIAQEVVGLNIPTKFAMSKPSSLD